MSVLKRIWIILLGLLLSFVCACSSKEIRIETGESFGEEIGIETEAETESKLEKVDSKALIYVYVCGHVENPGVYVLAEGDRIYQAIDRADGVLPEGDVTRLNLAEPLYDGQKIYVPSYEEMKEIGYDAFGNENSSVISDDMQDSDGLINLNKASKEQLMTLAGIGESKAEAIIRYRDEQGAFCSVEELMNVPGIKEGTYSKIKDRISIN